MKLLMICGIVLSQLVAVRSCRGPAGSLSPAEYVAWVEDAGNGLRARKTVGEYAFDLQYKPAEYIVLRESQQDFLTTKELTEGVSEIADMQYFTLRISDVNGGDLLGDQVSTMDEFTSRLAYFTGIMQQDIFLVEGKDTLPCLLYHFERTYGVDPRSTFLLGFPLAQVKNEAMVDKTLFFDDRGLGSGPVMISISNENLNTLPSLKLD